ncbi:MAG: YggT family protein [Chitinophagaceae bacterium]|nr:YggT family protein [Chitinophagaceae bacterium]
MIYLLKIFICILIVGLFLYSKLLPYKDRLNDKYKKLFNFFNTIFNPVLNFLKSVVKPFQVGQSLSVDMTQIVLLILLLLLINLFK